MEGRIKWPVKAKRPFEFFPLYSAVATQELVETFVTVVGSIICDFEARGYISLIFNSF